MEKNKKIISVSLDKDILKRLEEAYKGIGIKSRSSYVESILDLHLTREEGVQDGTEEKPVIISES